VVKKKKFLRGETAVGKFFFFVLGKIIFFSWTRILSVTDFFDRVKVTLYANEMYGSLYEGASVTKKF
jgi:hypothetical protein